MTRINTNVSSLVAQKTLARSNTQLQEALTRLSTGLRINVGKDDPAGLIASEVLRSDIISVQRAITNSERANQLIATADSALGQVSSLLNDVRGLVSEAANSGALSDEQIAANQLQIDSSLESIDRIARVTAFQGKRLLDGSLDFITTGIGGAVASASATVGSNTGSSPTASIGSATGGFATADVGAISDAFASVNVSLSAANTDIVFTALTAGTARNDFTVVIESGATAGNETVSLEGTTLTFTIASGTTTANEIIALLNGDTTSAGLTFQATTGGSGDGTGAFSAAGGVSEVTAGGVDGNLFNISATSGGSTFNDLSITFVSGGTQGSETVSYDSTSNLLTITIDDGVSTANDIITAINGAGLDFSAALAGSNGGGALSAAAGAASFSGGADGNIFNISATSGGTSFNGVSITFASGGTQGAETVSYDSTNNSLTITIDDGASTAADVIAAINAAGVGLSAAAAPGTVNSLGVLSAGAGVATLSGGTASNNVFVLSAQSTGSAFNGVSVVFSVGATQGSETVSYDSTNQVLTIGIASGSSTAADVIAAINASSAGFSAGLATGSDGTGVIVSSDTAATSGGSDGAGVSNLQIDQANFGTQTSIQVSVDIDQQATRGTLRYSGGSLTADLNLEIGGRNGFEVFNFGTGSTISQIADAINLVSDATGVSAAVSGSDLLLTTQDFGSGAFVSAKALTGSFATNDSLGAASTRQTGTDVSARINGVQAKGDGVRASINTSTLDLSFTINSALTDGSTTSFSIVGGGANFQLGPDVVSNQQARLGIQGVSTATLGGDNGTLFELRSGGSKSLANDVVGAAAVVEEVITKVTELRGRLGAFQRTTLQTNIYTLTDTLENLTDAESSIRDADFAVESARLTRAQILVQSGTAVLQIANSNPQNVLGLLQ